jgi:hypothetical protein
MDYYYYYCCCCYFSGKESEQSQTKNSLGQLKNEEKSAQKRKNMNII